MNHRIWAIEYAGSPKILWSEVRPTTTQLAIAAQLGVRVFPEDTFAVVASRLLEKVSDAIGALARDVSGHQNELAEQLGIDISDCNSSWSAFVRIKETLSLLNSDAARRMGLRPGDIVKADEQFSHALSKRFVFLGIQTEFEVSSVREDGEVFFKGGGQAPARYLTKLDPD